MCVLHPPPPCTPKAARDDWRTCGAEVAVQGRAPVLLATPMPLPLRCPPRLQALAPASSTLVSATGIVGRAPGTSSWGGVPCTAVLHVLPMAPPRFEHLPAPFVAALGRVLPARQTPRCPAGRVAWGPNPHPALCLQATGACTCRRRRATPSPSTRAPTRRACTGVCVRAALPACSDTHTRRACTGVCVCVLPCLPAVTRTRGELLPGLHRRGRCACRRACLSLPWQDARSLSTTRQICCCKALLSPVNPTWQADFDRFTVSLVSEDLDEVYASTSFDKLIGDWHEFSGDLAPNKTGGRGWFERHRGGGGWHACAAGAWMRARAHACRHARSLARRTHATSPRLVCTPPAHRLPADTNARLAVTFEGSGSLVIDMVRKRKGGRCVAAQRAQRTEAAG